MYNLLATGRKFPGNGSDGLAEVFRYTHAFTIEDSYITGSVFKMDLDIDSGRIDNLLSIGCTFSKGFVYANLEAFNEGDVVYYIQDSSLIITSSDINNAIGSKCVLTLEFSEK